MVYIALTTAKDLSEAKDLGKKLVKEGLAACTNVIPGLSSIYRWKEEIEEDDEALLLIKTTEEKLEDLKGRIRELHSYETPELLAFPVEDGTAEYLEWVEKSVG